MEAPMKSVSALVLLTTLAAASVYAADKKKNDPNQIGNRDVGKCLNFYSLEKEIALGKQLAEEVTREAKMNQDPLLGEFVNRVGQNLVRSSDAKVPFTFRVIDDEVPNAFALPGGFIFVQTGLLKLASEEDEFAGALAHEIAHVAARHMTCRATKGQIASAASIPLSILLPGGWGGVAARQGVAMGIPVAFLKFSRGDESEADFLGTQYMYAAGYDPTGAISMFEKLMSLRKTQPGVAARILADHPMDADRIDKTQKEIDRILPSKPEYVVNTSEYTDMRERLIAADARRKNEPNDGRPRLKVAPGSRPEGDEKDERPTIRRRELVD
jgi:beta-barrel assembly-enhancing protease